MDSKKFVKQLLQIVRSHFPELYKQQIKGKRAQFIAEAVCVSTEKKEGVKLGYVNGDLRLLWAVGEMFRRSCDRNLRSVVRPIAGLPDVLGEIGAFNHGIMARLCFFAFWEMVCSQFDTKLSAKGAYFLGHDWSIAFVVGGEQLVRDSFSDSLLRLIGAQAENDHMLSYAKGCVKTP